MGKTLYLECYSGISGDMTVASLLDLGADEKVLEAVLRSLPVQGFTTKITRVKKSGIDACDFDVVLDEEHENHDHDMAYLHGEGHEHGHGADEAAGHAGHDTDACDGRDDLEDPAVQLVEGFAEGALGAARHDELTLEAAVAGGVAGTARPHALLRGEDGLRGRGVRRRREVLLGGLLAHRMRPFISIFAGAASASCSASS